MNGLGPRPTLPTAVRGLAELAGIHLKKQTVTCGIASCRSSLTLRNLAARKAGIRVGEEWYCSSACFQAAAEARLLALSLPQLGRALDPDRMPLNLLLMSRGWLTREQSLLAMEEQKLTAERPAEVLVRLGYVDDQQIAVVRATHAGLPVYSAQTHGDLWGRASAAERALAGGYSGQSPMAKIVERVGVPRALCERYSMLALHFTPQSRRLLLGFVHNVEHSLMYAVGKMTDCKAEACFVTPADFRGQMQAADSHPGNDEVKFEHPGRPHETAQIVCNYAVEIEAGEARFARTPDYLWARLASATREVDLLFSHPRTVQSALA